MASASVDIREVLRQAGEAEADNNLSFGAAAGILTCSLAWAPSSSPSC